MPTPEVTPKPFDPVDLETLESLERYLRILKKAGRAIDQPFAYPEGDKSFSELEDDLIERLADGLPLPARETIFADKEPEVLPKPEPATQEQLSQIFLQLVDLWKSTPYLFERLRMRERLVLLPNLPGREEWGAITSSETTITVERKGKRLESAQVHLFPFTNPYYLSRTVIPDNHPLSFAALVKIFGLETIDQKEGKEELRGQILFRYTKATSESPLEVKTYPEDKGNLLWDDLNSDQAGALLDILTPASI